MAEYVNLFLRAALMENIMLMFFLGICTAIATSKSIKTAVGVGLAIILVQTITVPINNLLFLTIFDNGALSWMGLPNVSLGFIGLIAYIAVIASAVQILEMVLDKHFPRLYTALGVFLPLITVNCAILGGTLFTVERAYSIPQSLVYALGSGVGWAVAIVALAGVREKLRYSNIPEGLQGTGITFVILGLMAMSFMGLSGIRL